MASKTDSVLGFTVLRRGSQDGERSFIRQSWPPLKASYRRIDTRKTPSYLQEWGECRSGAIKDSGIPREELFLHATHALKYM